MNIPPTFTSPFEASDSWGYKYSYKSSYFIYNPTHWPLSSSLLGFPYRILNINHEPELLRGQKVVAKSP